MEFDPPILFNVTLHGVKGFEYLDQGIMKLDQQDGLPRLELGLSELGNFKAFAGRAGLDFSTGMTLCALDVKAEGRRLERFEVVISEVKGTLCLSGLGVLAIVPGDQPISHACFVVGYAL